jgi:glycosyltransferase involved in cell wall biosynthesis
MTTRLGLSTLAVSSPMGQQVYERHVTGGAAAVLGPGWEVRPVVVRSLRSPLPGTARLPSSLIIDASPALRRAAARVLYRGLDVVHRFDLRLPPAPGIEVVTVHDVVWQHFPDEGSPPADADTSARRASVVICPSEFSAGEVAGRLGADRVVAIHNGVDDRFFGAEPLDDGALARWGIRRPYVVHAGGCTTRKNLAGLAGAWARLAGSVPGTSLVLLGPEDDRRSRLFDPLPRTVRTGRVDDPSVLGILAAASAVVVPSLYEGFGLPALEGLAAGVPVVAARRSSLPEVCGEDATLVEPDADGLAQGLEAALAGGPAIAAMVGRGRERARRFTWDASLAAHREVWLSVAG